MNKQMEVKGYTKLDYIVLDAIGMQALMTLTKLLWEDKTLIKTCHQEYNVEEGTATIITNDYRYEFTNVPFRPIDNSLYGDFTIDTNTIYKQHIQKLKEDEVI